MREQRVTLLAELESRFDTVVRVDTVESAAELAWSLSGAAASARVFGRIRTYHARASGDTAWRAIVAPSLPVTFTADASRPEAQPLGLEPADGGCDARAAVVSIWRETFLQLPAELARGTSWRDSTHIPFCRDGVTLTAIIVRTFTVDSLGHRADRRVVHLRRDSRTRVDAAGTQFGDSVRAHGEGSGRATLAVALDGGSILWGEGRADLRLTLEGRRRTQQLVQRSALTISAP